MHPLVRNLYQRALHVGKDYPHPAGLDHVKRIWKKSLRDPKNCPSCYHPKTAKPLDDLFLSSGACQEELFQAVARGRYMVKEMIGIIQLKKYRSMRQRYGGSCSAEQQQQQAMERLESSYNNERTNSN